MIRQKAAAAEPLLDDARGIERVKSLSAMLQNANLGAIIDLGNRTTKAELCWSKTGEAT